MKIIVRYPLGYETEQAFPVGQGHVLSVGMYQDISDGDRWKPGLWRAERNMAVRVTLKVRLVGSSPPDSDPTAIAVPDEGTFFYRGQISVGGERRAVFSVFTT